MLYPDTLLQRVALLLVFAVCLAGARVAAAQEPDAWKAAEAAIVRLPPSSFPTMPRKIREWLDARGCRIPQHYAEPQPHNAIQGRFTSAKSRDWAVLCSRRGVSSVVVFAGGSDRRPWELNPAPDANYLQGIGGERIGFSRLIEVASMKTIRSYFEYHGRKPPPLSHEGIDDLFEPKASTVHYFARGRWLHWPGAD